MLAMIKPDAVRQGDASGVRPLALGCVLLRAIERRVAEIHKGAFAERLAPVQIAVDVKSGGQQLVLGMRTIMEVNPDLLIVKIDKSNAYNKLS